MMTGTSQIHHTSSSVARIPLVRVSDQCSAAAHVDRALFCSTTKLDRRINQKDPVCVCVRSLLVVRRTNDSQHRAARKDEGGIKRVPGRSPICTAVVSSLSFTASPVPESIRSHKQSSGDRCTKGPCPGVSFFDQRPSLGLVLPRRCRRLSRYDC